MKFKGLTAFLAAGICLLGGQGAAAQMDSPPQQIPTPIVKSTSSASAPKLSVKLAANLNRQTEISQSARQQAYAKLLEGQRYFWNISRQPQAVKVNQTLASQAFQEAVEINPQLAEGYTALSELALTTAPGDVDETIALAELAVKVEPDNFGGHRLLAFAHTIRSGLNRSSILNEQEAVKAIAEWKKVAELAPNFAEAWAFLSELYARTNKNDERLTALRRWQASAPPVETRFYRAIMGDDAQLAPESTALKLGAALIETGRQSEAVEFLSEVVADEPDNGDAIDLLKQAIDVEAGKVSPATVQALRQAVFANPKNVALIELLAQAQIRNNQFDEAVKSLRAAIENLTPTDKNSAATLQVSLGDAYLAANRYAEAEAAYEQALKIHGIEMEAVNTEEDREFAMLAFGKIVEAYKNAGQIEQAKAVIERSRRLLGDGDLFADKQLISLLREAGRKQEALQAVRVLRAKMKDDYSLLRLEATLLTELGRVDEAVKLVKTLLVKPLQNSARPKANQTESEFASSRLPPSPYYDDFTNYIFISSLYNQAKRSSEAIEAAKSAYAAADTEEKKQIADLSLATAQQTAGNFQSAEETLRGLLKKSPGNPVALNNLGYFLLERNEKTDEALTLIRRAVNIDPTNASYLDSLGWAYFKLGKLGEAELYLKEAARNNSASANIYEHLGDVYQSQQRFELAKAAWQKAMKNSATAADQLRLKEKLAGSQTK